MKILFVATEAAPFIKAGGLGEVMYSLPRALNRLGCDARVMIPKYLSIDTEKFPMKMAYEGLELVNGEAEPVICNVKEYESRSGEEEAPVHAYFLENIEYYEKRANIYGYADDAARWLVLSRGALEFVRQNRDWHPDVIVSSDWHTGLISNLLHADYKDDPILNRIATVFSIHNIYYQGMFNHHFVPEMEVDDGQSAIPLFADPRLLKINFMRRGIMYADAVNTVSPTYVKEIMTAEYGELLDPLLRERRSRVFGILNGIDYESNNPETDKYVEHNYGLKNIAGRLDNKLALQKKFNLPENKEIFLMGIVSRFTEQKGFDLLLDCGEALFQNCDFQLVALGEGDGKYMGFFKDLQSRYPERVGVHLSYDEVLPHAILAGADALLIPSRFEPSGLTQMEAMRYGTVPIVRKTGGLADSVIDYDASEKIGTGFVFENYNPLALYGAIVRAMEIYRHKNIWLKLQKSAMKADFSWTRSAGEYMELFKRALAFHASASKE